MGGRLVTATRTYPALPLVGVGAVVFRNDHVLLVKRGHPPRQGVWAFPGGLVELGERIFAAAQRELQEETGIQGEPIDVVDVFEIIERDETGKVRYHYVVIEVLLRYLDGEPRAADDAAEARWVAVEHLDGIELSPGGKTSIEKARKKINAH